MKYIKTYEDYTPEEIYSWWAGIKVSEDNDYYIIDLNDVYLNNKIIQLQKGLKNKVVKFSCKNHMKYEEFEISNVELSQPYDLIFKTKLPSGCRINIEDILGEHHIVDLTKPIKISKFHITVNKYNL